MPDLASLISSLGYGSNQQFPAMQAEGAFQSLAGNLSAIQRLRQALGLSYEKNVGALNDQRSIDQRRLLSGLANRGILHSGMTTGALADQGRQYTNALDNLVSQRDSGLSGAAFRELDANSDFSSSLSNIQLGAQQAQQQALTQQLIQEAQRRQLEAQSGYQTNVNNTLLQNAQSAYPQNSSGSTVVNPIAPTNVATPQLKPAVKTAVKPLTPIGGTSRIVKY